MRYLPPNSGLFEDIGVSYLQKILVCPGTLSRPYMEDLVTKISPYIFLIKNYPLLEEKKSWAQNKDIYVSIFVENRTHLTSACIENTPAIDLHNSN